jgi:hypothetical protein
MILRRRTKPKGRAIHVQIARPIVAQKSSERRK